MKRSLIFERDEYRCVYCGEQFDVHELTLDHIQPRARGGDRSEGNLVTACKACNTLKGQHRLSVFLFDQPTARANFLRYARHIWPRLRDLVTTELAELDEGRRPLKKI